ncbi:MAG: TIM barrel protein [Verrucomicrobia bacterium]|nr:TIM barrel protein [Verrucomicrobiota bacterium]
MNRRHFLQAAATAASAGAAALGLGGCASGPAERGSVVRRGRIRQSIVPWCYELFGEKWSLERICQVARELGCVSVELIAAHQYPVVHRHGLTCAIGQIDMAPDPPFVKGFNNPDHWPRVMQATRDAIDAAAAFGTRRVICFTGYSARNPDDPRSPKIPPDEGARNCVEGYKQVVGYAAKKQVTLCLEMLNTRDTSHPMKGHPGYQGDHVDYCMDILRRVGSPHLKLLFDVYHVQVMDGDIVRRIRDLKEYIGHVHVAGCPGRGEPDARQEIQYGAVMEALVESGYEGYVGQEFIPTRNPYQGLRDAVALCDV